MRVLCVHVFVLHVYVIACCILIIRCQLFLPLTPQLFGIRPFASRPLGLNKCSINSWCFVMVLFFAKVGGDLVALDLPVGSTLVGVGRANWWEKYVVKTAPSFASLDKYGKQDIDSIADTLGVPTTEPKVKGGMKVKPKSAVINGIINTWETLFGDSDEPEDMNRPLHDSERTSGDENPSDHSDDNDSDKSDEKPLTDEQIINRLVHDQVHDPNSEHYDPNAFIGGVVKGVKKPFLKKSDAVADFTKKIKKAIAESIGIQENVNAPAHPLPQLDPILGRVETIRTSGDIDTIKNHLDTLTDAQLNELREYLFGSKSGTKPEVRVTDIAYIMFTDLDNLDTDIEYIKNVKLRMIEVFTDVYCKSYYFDKSGSLNLNHGKFLKDVEAVMNYRRGIRRATEVEGGAEAVAEHGSSCAVS